MTETRAVGKLPGLDIEIRHRSEEGAEYLAITLRGTPDLGAATALLDPFRLLAAASAFNPWLAWAQAADPFHLWRRALGYHVRPQDGRA